MDPNAALAMVREFVKSIEEAGADERASLVDQLAESVSNLDEWLSRGGFLPDAWQR